MANTTDKSDVLLPQIEAAMDLYDISATAFGYFACGDPALLTKLRKGAVLRAKRRAKIERALARIHEKQGIPT